MSISKDTFISIREASHMDFVHEEGHSGRWWVQDGGWRLRRDSLLKGC